MSGSSGKMYFIYNPHAGMERIRSNLLDIIDIFSGAGYEVTVFPTRKPGDATEATANLEDGYDILACSGGDGTLDEVVAGMMKRKNRIPIGYVPAGSTNDFARTLKIPRDMRDAAEVVTGGEEFRCDMGSFNDRTFVYVAAFGLFTDVPYDTEQDLKNTFGHLAYLLEALSRLGQVRSYHMTVEHDGIKEKGEYVFGMISNSLSVAGISTLARKDVILDDGVFEVTLIKMPSESKDFGEIAAAVVSGASNSFVSFFKTDRISFRTEEPVSWTLDGEYGGTIKKAVLRNRHRAISIMIPRDADIPRLPVVSE